MLEQSSLPRDPEQREIYIKVRDKLEQMEKLWAMVSPEMQAKISLVDIPTHTNLNDLNRWFNECLKIVALGEDL